MYISLRTEKKQYETCPAVQKQIARHIAQDFWLPCQSKSCTNQSCRSAGRRKDAIMLDRHQRYHPTEYACTLSFVLRQTPSYREFVKGLKTLNNAIKYERKKRRQSNAKFDFRYKVFTDVTAKKLDFNICIETDGSFRDWQALKRWLRPMIAKAFRGHAFYLYLRPVRTQTGWAHYCTGWTANNKKAQLPPEDWLHKRLVFGTLKKRKKKTKVTI